MAGEVENKNHLGTSGKVGGKVDPYNPRQGLKFKAIKRPLPRSTRTVC